MRRTRGMALLALLAGTTTGCATATHRGDGLASIRARPGTTEAPPQRLVASASAAAPTADHAGIYARPDGLARFFPGLQKDAATPKVAKSSGRPTWLGRRLQKLGHGASSPTSLTYSTAPRSGPGRSLSRETGETSVLPVSLTLPTDHHRDREVTMTTAIADTDAYADALAPPFRSETKPVARAKQGGDEPEPPAEPSKPIEPPSMPEAPHSTPEAASEGPSPSPSVGPAEPTSRTGLDEPKPSSPAGPADTIKTPTISEPDARERPRTASPTPRPRAISRPEATKSPGAPTRAVPKPTTAAPKDRAADRARMTSTPRTEDPAVVAARAHAETARILGLPDPTLPAAYYRGDAPPVRGDAAVAATTAAVQPSVPCPHCGQGPHWGPSLQRFGRRIFGLGEFAPPPP